MKESSRFENLVLILIVSFCLLIHSKPAICSDAGKPHWEFAGWYGGGCYPALVADPHVEGRLYLLSDVAGLWRSNDRGENWYFINAGLVNLNIATLAIAPSDSNIVYIGTKAGMMRSDNAGKTWQYIASTRDKITFERPSSYRAIYVDSKNPNIVYAGTRNGEVFYSTNAGNTWNQIGKTDYPFDKKTIITAIVKENDCFLVSSNEGLARYTFSKNKWDIVIRGKEIFDMVYLEDTLYISIDNRISFSQDFGKTWQDTAPIPNGKVARLSITKSKDGSIIFLAGWQENWNGGVYLSKDYGKTWENAGKTLVDDEKLNPMRAWTKGFGKPTSVSFDPFNLKVMYFTDWWGVWRSDDVGSSWSEKIKGAPNSCGSDIAITLKGNILVATMDNGLLKSSDEGKTYEAVFPSDSPYDKSKNGHVWRVLSYGKNAENILATSSPWNDPLNQVILSNDGGKSFQLIREGLPSKRPKVNTMWGQGYPRALAIDPTNPNNVYLGIDGDDGGGLFISNDAGKSWHRAESQPDSLRIYNALAVDPTNPKMIFWGACGENGGVHASDDQGKTWRKIFSECEWIFDLAISPKGVIYACGASSEGNLFISKDGGRSWAVSYRSNNNAACDAIYINPQNENDIFVSTVGWSENPMGKILYSNNAGRTWKDITYNLPSFSGAAAMMANKDASTLYILLYAGSVYKIPLSTL